MVALRWGPALRRAGVTDRHGRAGRRRRRALHAAARRGQDRYLREQKRGCEEAENAAAKKARAPETHQDRDDSTVRRLSNSAFASVLTFGIPGTLLGRAGDHDSVGDADSSVATRDGDLVARFR